MKKADLDKVKGKNLPGSSGSGRGGLGTALDRREQALARKRELLQKHTKSK
jgi:hypothetical protein